MNRESDAGFTTRQIKRAILAHLIDTPPGQNVHISTVLAHALAAVTGGRVMTPAAYPVPHRVVATLAVHSMRNGGLIVPTYHDPSQPESHYVATNRGRELYAAGLVDELDEALAKIAPGLCDQREGAHEAMLTGGPDCARQVAHSCREIIFHVLQAEAPVEEVKAQPWFVPSRDPKATAGVTHSDRVRLLLQKRGREDDFDDVSLEVVGALNTLGRSTHRRGSTLGLSPEDAISRAEIALRSCCSIPSGRASRREAPLRSASLPAASARR